MRKDHLITNLIGISFFSFIAALVLMIAFAVIRGIIGAVVPEAVNRFLSAHVYCISRNHPLRCRISS